jgi:hypothetical protein
MSLQASWRILKERDMWQSRAAEPRPQLEALLQRLLIVFLRSVFHDYDVALFTDFAALLALLLPFIWDLDKSRRRHRLGNKLHYVVLQEAYWMSTTTTT